MRKNISLTAFTIFLLFLSISVTGQSAAENEQCNDEFALFLVSQQVSEGRSVTDIPKKIRILNRSGDFIWPYDQPTARIYLAEAFKTAFDSFVQQANAPKPAANSGPTFTVSNPDLRFEVLRTVAKRDPAWARKLVEEILSDFEKNVKTRKVSAGLSELQYLLNMANTFADVNTDLSWFVYRKVMEHPLDQHWFYTLHTLSGKDDRMASALYSELLMRYRDASPRRLLFLSAYPMRSERTLGIDKYMYIVSVPSGLEPLPDFQQRFFDTFFNRIAAYAANPQERMQSAEANYRAEPVYMMSALNDVEPMIISEMPFLLQRFAAAKAQATSMISDEMRKDLDSYSDRLKRTALGFNGRYELLKKADEEGKLTDAMIINMIFGGFLTEEQYKLMEPWMDKITEENVRKETTNYFWFQRASLAVKESRYADAEKYAAKVPEIDHRAILAFQIAEAQMKSHSDTASAYQTLSEVSKLAATMENSAAKAKIFLGITNQYLELNPGFAMDELAEAVRVMNRAKDPDMNSGSVFRQIVGKQGGWFAVFQLPGYNIENTFEKMGEQDFGLTLSNARAIDDKYLKTIAVIAAAKNCVGKAKPAPATETGK